MYGDGQTGGQPGVDVFVVVEEQLVRSPPYADDERGGDEDVQEHVEHGEAAVDPGRVGAASGRPARSRRRARPERSAGFRAVLVGRHGTALADDETGRNNEDDGVDVGGGQDVGNGGGVVPRAANILCVNLI